MAPASSLTIVCLPEPFASRVSAELQHVSEDSLVPVSRVSWLPRQPSARIALASEIRFGPLRLPVAERAARNASEDAGLSMFITP